MRLAYINADRGVPVGGNKGASIHVRALAAALHRRGHAVHIVSTAGGPAAEGSGPRVLEVGYDRTLKGIRRSLEAEGRDGTVAREIHALLLNQRVDEALRSLHQEAPLEGLYERYSLWSLAGLRFAREHRLPFVLEVNAPLVEEQARYRSLALAGPARAIEHELLQGAGTLVVPCEEMADEVRRRVGRRGAIRVQPNCVTRELFEAPPPLPAAMAARLADRFVVAFVGSLKPWHGLETLLTAFEVLYERAPRAHLLVLGDGPRRGAVQEAVASLGPDAVTWPGAVRHEEIPSWLAAASVGAAPYPRLERFYFSPLKIVEYQAAGLVVVASAVGQLARTVEPGRTGLLVEPGDAGELAAALLRLERSPELCRTLGRRGRRRVLRELTWDRAAERVEAWLRGGAGAGSAAAPGSVAATGRGLA